MGFQASFLAGRLLELDYAPALKNEAVISSCCFLVACTRLYNPLCSSVGRSVTLYFLFMFLFLWLLLPKWSCDLKYMAPAHPHATLVAVYPALLNNKKQRTVDFWV